MEKSKGESLNFDFWTDSELTQLTYDEFEDEERVFAYYDDVQTSIDWDHSIEYKKLVLQRISDGKLFAIDYSVANYDHFWDDKMGREVVEKEIRVIHYVEV